MASLLGVLALMKNVAATPPKITAMIIMKSSVELILVPSMGVPEPYAPTC